MTERRSTQLLGAAGILHSAGRNASARTLLDGLAQDHAASLRAATIEAAAQGHSVLTWLGATALMRARPEEAGRSDAKDAWNALLAAAQASGQSFDAEMLHLHMALTVFPTIPAVAPRGPDLAYVLALSLPWDATGYAMRSHTLIQALLARGKDVCCLTRPGFPWDRGITEVSSADTVDGVVYHRTGGPGDRVPRTPAEFLSAAKVLMNALAEIRPTRVMAASNHATAIPALLAARQLGLPFIYEVRGFWELSLVTRDPGFAHSREYQISHALEGAVAAAADLVLTLNGAMRDELIRRGVAADRIVLLPNAADPQALRPAPRDAALAARHGLPEGVPVIGYIGSFTDYEGLEDLISACSDLAKQGQDFRLLLVGWDPRGENRIGPVLRALAQDLGLTDRLVMPGVVPRDQVAAWYSLIDIAPVPRRRFPVTELVSPLKPLEAMAMAKAVVLSDLPPLAEMVAPGQTGCLFPAGDRAALARILAELAVDPTRCRSMGAAARELVLTHHTWEARADDCWTAIESIRTG